MPRESAIKDRACAALRALGFFVVRLAASPNQMAGLPDVLAIRSRRTFFIEFKVGDNKPTRLQEAVMAQILASGAHVFVAHSAQEAIEAIEHDSFRQEQIDGFSRLSNLGD